jgi:hypothetical protein
MTSRGRSIGAALVFVSALLVGTFSGYLSQGARQAAAAPAATSCIPWGRTCPANSGTTKCCKGLHCAFDGYTWWCRF